jgi:hypothetical protein
VSCGGGNGSARPDTVAGWAAYPPQIPATRRLGRWIPRRDGLGDGSGDEVASALVGDTLGGDGGSRELGGGVVSWSGAGG